MSSFKVKSLKVVSRFLTNRVKTYSNLLSYVKQHLFFELLEQKDDDIYIITFMKSGTTWMQMICYQLLTDGNMHFNHIYDVSPWLSNAAITDVDAAKINALPSPRFYKCHDAYGNFDPKTKSRFIFVYRDGMDVAVSLSHHIRNYNMPDQTLEKTYEDYFSLGQENNWFDFTKSWLENEHGYNILFVKYEDLKNNFDKTLLRIANFLDVRLTDEISKRVKERSSFAFMKKYEDKFGEQSEDNRIYNQFIRKGEVGSGKELTVDQKEHFNEMYSKFIKSLEGKL